MSGQAKFPLGRVIITPATFSAFLQARQNPIDFLSRHQRGDWGDLPQEDIRVMVDAVRDGDRVLSIYTLTTGERIWIYSEGDRRATTVLLPREW